MATQLMVHHVYQSRKANKRLSSCSSIRCDGHDSDANVMTAFSSRLVDVVVAEGEEDDDADGGDDGEGVGSCSLLEGWVCSDIWISYKVEQTSFTVNNK